MTAACRRDTAARRDSAEARHQEETECGFATKEHKEHRVFSLSSLRSFVADQAIAWSWDRLADPRGALTKVFNSQLDECARRIIVGTREVPGLQFRLEAWSRERATQRRIVILQAVDVEGGSR